MNPSPSPTSSHAALPLRVAAIDAGSNALRLLATEFTTPTRYTTLALERGAVRLGEDVFRLGQLGPDVMAAAVEAFVFFRRRMEEVRVSRYRAVTTSAVRESANRDEFLERVRQETGIELEVISGTEEAALVQRAVASRMALRRGPWVLVDVGGGSTEVSGVGEGAAPASASYPVGAVRLLRDLPPPEEDLERFRQLLAQYVAGLGISLAADHERPAGLIAIGGNIEALARLAGKADTGEGTASLSLAELRALIAKLSRLSLRHRIEELALRPDRADVILPAALLYEHLALLADVEEVRVPWVGVREGIVFELLDAALRGEDTPPASTPIPPA